MCALICGAVATRASVAEASDPKRGAQVFQEACAVCHQANGQGLRWGPDEAVQGHRYQFPPLWGPDSYNDGGHGPADYRRELYPRQHAVPDRALKPADATYPPFLGPFSPTQHLTDPAVAETRREELAKRFSVTGR